MRLLCLIFLCCLVGCESARPRLDPDLPDAQADAAMSDAALDGAAVGDAVVNPPRGDAGPADGAVADGHIIDMRALDALLPDGIVPDGSRPSDMALDGGLNDAMPPDRGAEDGAVPDGALGDAAIDGALQDGAIEDGGLADAELPPDGAIDPDLGPPTGFVSGVAQAADGRTVVEIAAAGISTRTNAAGGFRLGPLPVGEVTLRFAAENHELRTREAVVESDLDTALDAPVLLYRGRRIGPAPDAQLRFSGDGNWVIWSQGDALWRRGTAIESAALELLPRGFEVFLGFVPGRPAVAVRRRVQPGLAGNIEVIDLNDATRERLFVEAQPWVRWRGANALGMVGTRDGLSTLQLGAPGEPPADLAEGVPWLLVTTLADGEPAWAQADGDAFAIWRGGDVLPAEPIAPDLPASNDFLTTTPGRAGLLWLSPTGDLTRWEPDQPARVLAEDVIPTPRPRFLTGGRLLFWRADPNEPGLERLFLLSPNGAERLIINTVDGNSLRLAGERYYIARPQDGLYTGQLDAPDAAVRLLAGDRIQYVTQGPGVIALVNGAAWTAVPGAMPMPLNLDGLTTLQALNLGATAWQAEGGVLWWLPGPEMAAPATALVRGAPRARRVVERGNAAVYPLGPDGYFRVAIPPDEPVAFDESTTELTSVSADLALAYTPEGWLYGVVPQTGQATGWAPVVTRLVVAGNRQWALYVSDRGTYLVRLE